MEEAGLENKKKKISLGNIIILIILLLVLGFAISYFASDELELGKCKESKDCVKYQVFSIKGDQYVCINNQSVEDDSIKNKILSIKYSIKQGLESEPESCLCENGFCEAS